jgi:hypothetical protein
MPSKPPIRVLLRDSDSNFLHRIFSLCIWKDHKNEEYLKIILPDFSENGLIKSKLNEEHRFLVDQISSQGVMESFREFSYHFDSGISHFKDNSKHIDQVRSLPKLNESRVLEVCRIGIGSIVSFAEKKDDDLSPDDLILPSPFDGRPRSLNIYIALKNWSLNIVNSNPDEYSLVGGYSPNITAEGAQVIITDNVIMKQNHVSGIAFLRPDNPVRCHQP